MRIHDSLDHKGREDQIERGPLRESVKYFAPHPAKEAVLFWESAFHGCEFKDGHCVPETLQVYSVPEAATAEFKDASGAGGTQQSFNNRLSENRGRIPEYAS